jgi:Ca2+-binding RTX toxin-like protein
MAKIVLSGSDFVNLSFPDIADLYSDSTSVYQSSSLAVVSIAEDSDLVFQGAGFTSFDERGYPTAGTITQFTVVFAGSGRAVWSESTIDAADFEDVIRTGDTAGFIEILFGGDDRVTLNPGGASFNGFAGNDRITGKGAEDFILGGDGSDVLLGAGNNDAIIGGDGKDTITGGGGPDAFGYSEFTESTTGGIDTITDLTDVDTIILTPIDANEGTGADDAFTIVGAFSGTAGELVLTYQVAQERTRIEGDVDGDGDADLIIFATGDRSSFTNFDL